MTNPLPAVVVWHINILELVGAAIVTAIIIGVVVYELVKSFRRKR